MDLYRTIRMLHQERERLNRLIESLELLRESGAAPGRRHNGASRRGRKGMSTQERHEVSERMKRYWAARRASSTQSVPSPPPAE